MQVPASSAWFALLGKPHARLILYQEVGNNALGSHGIADSEAGTERSVADRKVGIWSKRMYYCRLIFSVPLASHATQGVRMSDVRYHL